MNTKIIMLLTVLIVFVSSCSDNEYIKPNSFSDVSWYYSIAPGAALEIQAGRSISFMDVSVGALTHQWSIEKPNSFLKPVFSASDSLSLPLFIDNSLDTINPATTIHVFFKNQGVAKVRLRNTFSEQVSYKGKKPLKAIQEGNVWVIDTTFVVTVK